MGSMRKVYEVLVGKHAEKIELGVNRFTVHSRAISKCVIIRV